MKPEKPPATTTAKLMVQGIGMNALTAMSYSRHVGSMDLKECMAALVEETRAVQRGDMDGMEAILAAQAVTLNSIFTQLACYAAKIDIVEQIDRFSRLAFKAQNQCRATIETLALIKNPPTVFARQANIAHGPQQVNNDAGLTPAISFAGQVVPRARAGSQKIEQIKVLEAHGERLDTETASATSGSNQAMAAVGTLNRPTNR